MPNLDWRNVDKRLGELGCPMCKGAGVVQAGFTVQVDPAAMVAKVVDEKYRVCPCQQGRLSLVEAEVGALSVAEGVEKPKKAPWIERFNKRGGDLFERLMTSAYAPLGSLVIAVIVFTVTVIIASIG